MTVELGEFPSASTPGKSYTVKRGGDGVVYCDCWAWKKTRNCSHKKAVERQLHMAEAGFKEDTSVAPAQVKVVTRRLTIQQAIDRAVAEMKGNV